MYRPSLATLIDAPFDRPTAPIDVHALRAWWERKRQESRVVKRRRPERVTFIRQR